MSRFPTAGRLASWAGMCPGNHESAGKRRTGRALAGMAVSLWRDEHEVADAWSPRTVVEPNGPSRREQWLEARGRALRWEPALSALDF
jgi:transposase